MGAVGLLYVGAVLFINGLMLLGRVDARAAGVFNLFVGAMQVVFPTIALVRAESPLDVMAAAGIYLFGFTYLYVGIGLLAGLDGTGLGWFSLFVAVAALGFAWLNARNAGEGVFDNAFAVIWVHWAFLWSLFFLVLGLGRDDLSRYTGAVAAVQGIVTAAIPAFLLISGDWRNTDTLAVALAVVGVVVYAALWPLTRATRRLPAPRAGEPATATPETTGPTAAETATGATRSSHA